MPSNLLVTTNMARKQAQLHQATTGQGNLEQLKQTRRNNQGGLHPALQDDATCTAQLTPWR